VSTALRSDAVLAAIVLVTACLALSAPVLGRLGSPAAADVAMLGAAGGGVLSFALAALATLRAARSRAGAPRAGRNAP
jgi:hypothetical protein